MKLENDLPYKIHEKVDISQIQKVLLLLDRNLWYLDNSRQLNPGSPHKQTTSLILQYCPGEPEFDRKFLQMYPAYSTGKIPISNRYITKSTPDSFFNDLKEIKEILIDERLNYLTKLLITELEKKFNGISGLVVYAKLPPGKKIHLHSDPGYYLSVVHRLHIPIFSNKNCFFYLDNHIINMEEGYLYEINNLMKHKVENKGDTDRVHLIIDIIPNSVYNNQ